ncbi:MAG TPA: glycosyl hydrolase-related protein, partial [Anaerolineae bacterium]
VSINDDQRGFTMVARGLPEYEAYINPFPLRDSGNARGTTLALTLLRCTGWLSRNDLTMRSGHAGPALETPGAQEIGRHTFEYAVIPHRGDWHNALAQAHAFVAPLRAVASDSHFGPLPSNASFVNATPNEFVLTAVKMAEQGESLIVRGFNSGEAPIQVTLQVWRKFTRAWRVRINEEELAEVDLIDGRQVNLDARPREIVTIRFD